ncbi:hypothetical protein C0J45_1142, partial [Silurus meridionalis]
MGCSPSKGHFAGIYNHQNNALQFGSNENNVNHFSGGTEIKSQAETPIVSSGLTLLQEENAAVQLQGKKPTESAIIMGSADIGATKLHSQEELLMKENSNRKHYKTEKNDGCKRRQRERVGKTVYIQSNLDFPQSMLKAHQAAYAYLKNNIPKYESLLGILEKATQTQLSLQPMVTLLALQYEEINQAIDEVASEGEQMLKMHGYPMSLPAVQNYVLVSQDMPEAEINSTESSSDILQQMLHQLIKKMRLVGDCVKELGETSLEETVDYYGSLYQLLSRKLEAKRAAESHLKQVLACVESYASRTLNSEDSALHSEDSGIGVENECLNGSVRHCSKLENSGTGIQSLYGCPEDSLPDHPYVKGNKYDDVDNNIVKEDSNEDEKTKHEQGNKTDVTDRKISTTSKADSSQPHQVKHQNKRSTNNTYDWNYKKERHITKSKTAEDLAEFCQAKKHRHSLLWGAQRSLSADCLYRRVNDYMVQGQNKIPNDNTKPEWINKKHSPSQFCGLQDGNNGPFKKVVTSWTIPFSPLPPGKNAVKRLINTFSQGVCDTSNQKPLNEPTRGNFLPVINNYRAGVTTSDNKNTNSYKVVQRFQVRSNNMDSLPPPPPEVMMDNSFKRDESTTRDEDDRASQTQKCSTQRQKCCISQCPRASRQTVSLPPSQASISRGYLNMNESHTEQDHGLDLGEGEASTLYANCHCPTTPPVTRARVPPSNYSTCLKVSNATALPPSPACPVNSQEEIFTASFASHIPRWTRRDSDNENGFMTASSSKSFYNARSVFSQENQSAPQSVKTSCRSTLPRPWGEPKVSRGRLQAPYLPQISQRSIPN